MNWARVLAAGVIGIAVSQVAAYLCYARAGSTSLGGRPLRDPALPGFLRGVWPEPDEGTIDAGLTIGRTRTTLRCPVASPPDFRDDPAKYGLYTDSYGWPARSLVVYRACVFTSGANGGGIDLPAFFKAFKGRAGLKAGWDPPSWWPRNRAGGMEVPVWPLWDGLAINAGAYGLTAWLGLALPGVARRMIRRRGGRCIDCGYDAAGLSVCPECGAAAG